MNKTTESVYLLIGKHGKMKTANMIGISSITLAKRLEDSIWKKAEIAIIENLSK